MSLKIKVEKPSDAKLESLNIKEWGIWEKEESSFDWEYGEEESCYILAGDIIVKTDSEEVHIGVGDFVTFPAGLKCHWTINKAVRKHFKFG